MSNELPIEHFDDFVASLMKEWHVPGCAVGIVQPDRVILAKGFGVRQLGHPEPVDEETMFAIGSITKALITTMIAGVIDEGKMQWDGFVSDYFPEFKLLDETASNLITVRDLATHRSGLPATANLLRYELPYSGEEAIFRLRYIKPLYPFRTRYCYCDIAFAVAGECAERAAGEEWSALLHSKVFQPLSMTSTHTSTDRLRKSANLAHPHAFVEGSLETVVFLEKENSLGAASANSNLCDLLKFVQLHLSRGRLNGKQLFKKDNISELHRPQMLIRDRRSEGVVSTLINLTQPYSIAGQTWSCLGWDAEDLGGHKLIVRAGAVPGMGGILILIPDKSIGIVILSNSDVGGIKFARILSTRIAQAYLGLPPEEKSPEPVATPVDVRSKPDLPDLLDLELTNYVGVFSDLVIGDATVTIENDHLVLAVACLIGDLAAKSDTRFTIAWREPYMRQFKMFVNFTLDDIGLAARLEIEGEGVFERVQN